MYDLAGTLRAYSAEATLALVRPLAVRCGITRVANVTHLDRIGLPTWAAVRPLARSLTVSQGKGLSHTLAEVSALMEAIEFHHAETIVPDGAALSIRHASSDAAFVRPERLARRKGSHLDPDITIHWAEGHDLFSGRSAMVPHQLFELGAGAATGPVFIRSTSGLASGNTHDEAILHALCEAIERDQTTFWNISRGVPHRTLTRIDPSSLAGAAAGLLEMCVSAELEVFLWWITGSIQVPAFACMVVDETGRTAYRQGAVGYGCHPKKSIALLRAITEALQARLTYVAGGRDDAYWRRYRDALGEGAAARRGLASCRADPPCVCFDDIEELPDGDSFQDYVRLVLERLSRARLDTAIVVDLTSEDIGIPVVFVCVPDLELHGSDPLYVPGRRMTVWLLKQHLR